MDLCWWSDLKGFILNYQGIHKEACALKVMGLAVICCCCACFKAQSMTALEQTVDLCWSDLRGFILKHQGIHKEACALKMMSLAVICCCCACFMLATCNFENTHSL